MSALGVALIGLTNLLVSFALALWLAFRARQLQPRLYLKLLQTVWTLFKAEPRRFFFPPKADRYPDTVPANSQDGQTGDRPERVCSKPLG